jgi:uncharacterized protein YkwD
MERLKIGVILAAALAVLVTAGGNSPDDSSISALLAAHNRERAKEGRTPLGLSAKLTEAAKVHAEDMAAHGKLEHKGSDGSTAPERIKRTRYVHVRVGENIAKGATSVDEVMKMWLKSPGHRANILADFTEMGAALTEDDDGETYWCVDFGIPMPRLKPDEAAAAVVERINHDRQAGKQPPLKADPALGRAAMSLARAMAEKDSLELEGDPFAALPEKDARGRELRLGLASGAPTPEEAIKSLLAEDKDELPSFREIGVGYAIAKSGAPYWCAILAKPAKERLPGAL